MHLDIVFKAFVGMFAAIIIVGCGLGVVNGFSQSIAVDNYFEAVSKVIVESNFNAHVIESCKQDALDNGFELMVEVYQASKAGVKTYARIELKYDFEISLFGLKQEKIQVKIV